MKVARKIFNVRYSQWEIKQNVHDFNTKQTSNSIVRLIWKHVDLQVEYLFKSNRLTGAEQSVRTSIKVRNDANSSDFLCIGKFRLITCTLNSTDLNLSKLSNTTKESVLILIFEIFFIQYRSVAFGQHFV